MIEEVSLAPRKRPPFASRTRVKPKVVAKAVKKKKKASRSLSKYKKELDRVFSIYIRAKYPKQCFTCGKPGALQNGHFIIRKYLATRWEEDNCRPQCVGCNIYGKGMSIDFEENLIRDLGAERVQELKDARKQVIKMTEEEYVRLIAHYKNLVETYYG